MWATAIGFHSIAGFDAMAALVVDISTPWPEFFMIEVFGRSMFVGAEGMHVVALAQLATADVRSSFDVA